MMGGKTMETKTKKTFLTNAEHFGLSTAQSLSQKNIILPPMILPTTLLP